MRDRYQADVRQMEAGGGFAGDRTPLGFPEPEPVRVPVTDFLRFQGQPKNHRSGCLCPASRGSDKSIGNGNGSSGSGTGSVSARARDNACMSMQPINRFFVNSQG